MVGDLIDRDQPGVAVLLAELSNGRRDLREVLEFPKLEGAAKLFERSGSVYEEDLPALSDGFARFITRIAGATAV